MLVPEGIKIQAAFPMDQEPYLLGGKHGIHRDRLVTRDPQIDFKPKKFIWFKQSAPNLV